LKSAATPFFVSQQLGETSMRKCLSSIVTSSFLLVATAMAAQGQPSFTTWAETTNLGAMVNSGLTDQHPAISKKGLSLYFVSNRAGGSGALDIYVSQRETTEDPWGTPVNLGPHVNSAGTENAPTLSRDGHLLFFGSNRTGGCGGFDLWATYRRHTHDDFGWEPPFNLGCTINTSFDEDGPTYFEDEATGVTTLYFTSLNRPGNIGDWDIYASTLQADGTFSLGQLVTELSSVGRDTRTSISRNGLEMLITSNRTGGLGGLDVWVSTRDSTSDSWSAALNLGAPVNSADNDGAPALSFDGTTLYFYSLRTGGYGGNDLYVAARSKLMQ
jgi:WD40-like Beta Propeller Repeat